MDGEFLTIVFKEESAQLIAWKVKVGQKVCTSTVLCEYKNVNKPELKKLRSSLFGTVERILVKENTNIKSGDVLMLLAQCGHDILWRNICADCGIDMMGVKLPAGKFLAMEHSIPDLLISEQSAVEIGINDQRKLLKARKLVLLVDLDQTLIHTTNDNIPANLKDVYHFQLKHGKDNQQWWYHTKLRPYTRTFLQNISKYYQLHICTFGVRPYAHAIAGFLDPDKKYFQQRILSRDECFHPNLKALNLRNLFPSGDSMVCIIDDREDVWNSAPNMIRVTPYSFFYGCADINAPPQAAKSKVVPRKARHQTIVRVPVAKADKKTDGQVNIEKVHEGDDSKCVSQDESKEEFVEMIEWEDNDDYLIHLENILCRIHKSFYDIYDPNPNPVSPSLDLKRLVVAEKKKVLQNCNILFSGVVPLEQQLELNWAYKLATSFGATVQKQLSLRPGPDATTHLVAMRDNTEKVKKAKGHAVHVVNIDWLIESIERWEKLDEALYPVINPTSSKYLLYSELSRLEIAHDPHQQEIPDSDRTPEEVLAEDLHKFLKGEMKGCRVSISDPRPQSIPDISSTSKYITSEKLETHIKAGTPDISSTSDELSIEEFERQLHARMTEISSTSKDITFEELETHIKAGIEDAGLASCSSDSDDSEDADDTPNVKRPDKRPAKPEDDSEDSEDCFKNARDIENRQPAAKKAKLCPYSELRADYSSDSDTSRRSPFLPSDISSDDDDDDE